MPIASGTNLRIAYTEETQWGVTPVTPSMRQINSLKYGESLGANIDKAVSEVITNSRAIEDARGGNISAGGSFDFELPILGIGRLLKHALGAVTTTGPVALNYTHVIKRGTLPVGMTFEKGFTDLPQFFRFAGSKINELSLEVENEGIVSGSLELLAKSMTTSSTQLGVPVATTHRPFMHHEAVILENAAPISVASFSFNLTNELADDDFVIGSRYRDSLTEGKGECTGETMVKFSDLIIINKWLNETSTSFKITFTTGTQSIEFFFPLVKFFEDSTPKGADDKIVWVPLNFQAFRDPTENTDLRITIVNQETTL